MKHVGATLGHNFIPNVGCFLSKLEKQYSPNDGKSVHPIMGNKFFPMLANQFSK